MCKLSNFDPRTFSSSSFQKQLTDHLTTKALNFSSCKLLVITCIAICNLQGLPRDIHLTECVNGCWFTLAHRTDICKLQKGGCCLRSVLICSMSHSFFLFLPIMVLNKVKEKFIKIKIVTQLVNSIWVPKAQFFFIGLAYQGKRYCV